MAAKLQLLAGEQFLLFILGPFNTPQPFGSFCNFAAPGNESYWQGIQAALVYKSCKLCCPDCNIQGEVKHTLPGIVIIVFFLLLLSLLSGRQPLFYVWFGCSLKMRWGLLWFVAVRCWKVQLQERNLKTMPAGNDISWIQITWKWHSPIPWNTWCEGFQLTVPYVDFSILLWWIRGAAVSEVIQQSGSFSQVLFVGLFKYSLKRSIKAVGSVIPGLLSNGRLQYTNSE